MEAKLQRVKELTGDETVKIYQAQTTFFPKKVGHDEKERNRTEDRFLLLISQERHKYIYTLTSFKM